MSDRTLSPAITDPDPDVILVLLGQHARVKDLCAKVDAATGEEVVLRPVSAKAAGEQVTDARNAEEKEANEVLTELEKLDVTGQEFASKFAQFEKAVLAHAEHEEREEFPAVQAQCSVEERQKMGKRLLKAEESAPTHPHASAAGSPAAQKVTGPFAAMVDKVRDAL